MSLENKVDITVYRDMVSKTLTDRQWEVIAGHIEGAVEEFLEINLDVWLDNIDELVAEEDKYED
jgi:hypothetical protein